MDESGNTKDDLKLPTGTDDAEKLAEQLQAEFESGKEIAVTVLKARRPFLNLSGVHAMHQAAQVCGACPFT